MYWDSKMVKLSTGSSPSAVHVRRHEKTTVSRVAAPYGSDAVKYTLYVPAWPTVVST